MKRIITIVLVGLSMILVVILAAYFGQSKSVGSNFDKGQRFTAKPGTERKNAIALTSNKRPNVDTPKSKKDPVDEKHPVPEDEEPLTVKSLSAPSDDSREGPAHDRTVEALNNASPESGLQSLETLLTLPHDQEQTAFIYEAMGQLYAQLDPPEFEKAAAAFEEARQKTDDVAFEQSILLKSVQVLMQGGLDDRAREQLGPWSEKEEFATQTQFRLHLLRGQLAERAGNNEEAERIYLEVLDHALALPDTLTPKVAETMVRGAGLRLTSLYRAQDRDSAAEVLAKDLEKELKRIEEAT